MADDGDKSLIIFDHPKDVRGTALLTFSHKTGNDDQWLYLPALKRTKRIASNNKSGPFMGSEFAYEDISSQEVEEYTYKYLRDESYEGTPVYVIERYPTDDNSGYTKQIVWMDAERYIPLKVDYYDRKQSHLKTLTFHDYQQYKGKHWRPLRMEMQNLQTGKSTTLAFAEYEFDQGLSERDFGPGRPGARALKPAADGRPARGALHGSRVPPRPRLPRRPAGRCRPAPSNPPHPARPGATGETPRAPRPRTETRP